MPIPAGNETETAGPGYPVLNRRSIGEKYAGGVLKYESRDRLKDGEPIVKANGKHAQELVVTLLTFGGDMTASIGGTESVPQRGDIVRDILKGGEFGQWIDAKNLLPGPVNVGDRYYKDTEHALVFESTGQHNQLAKLDTQEQVAERKAQPAYADRRTESIGFRGDLQIRHAKDDEAEFVAECEKARASLQAPTPAGDDPAPADSGKPLTDLF